MAIVRVIRQNSKQFNLTHLTNIETSGVISTITEGLIYYRKRISGSFYYIDYSANGGLTWEVLMILHSDEDLILITVDDAPEGYRELVRDGDYCIDHALTPVGFDGNEGDDWETVYKITK